MGNTKKYLTLFSLFFIMISLFSTSAFAATLGERLTAPEAGWQRIDSSNVPNIIFEGTFHDGPTNVGYKGSEKFTNTIGDKIKFDFTGTKLRLICGQFINRSDEIEVYIDGVMVTKMSQHGPHIGQVLKFEILDLPNTRHTVEIINRTSTSNTSMGLDAIDIDESGEILFPYEPLNLTASPNDPTIRLTWGSVNDATGYVIKRSTTTGGPYETIETNHTNTTYDDLNVEKGVTYYYVVTAIVNGVESTTSNEDDATLIGDKPTDPDPKPTGDNALLVIKMISGLEKEFELTASEVQDFIDWYNERADGHGKETYMFDKTFNKGPFTARKDYVAFSKIQSFEVMEFTK
ncbi:fibronectin type III domain-containing protein [Brevibacillus brevis]|uniref:fibronectin type III domain-containing protein n=1 Tax=Brevibacillus brevis TaxID=1393 RepID=UPI000AB60047|nr:fibronectin type III domain-containing protein [Brevibacillus brevis]